jgi:sialate O-acetylesterase
MFTVERNATLEPLSDVTGAWQVASPATVPDFSATAYFFGKKIQDLLGVPVGIIHSSWGGSKAEAWMDANTLASFPTLEIPTEINESRRPNHTPTLLYNAMLHPFIGYTLKGMIWYQGESNREEPEQYKTLFPGLISSWREQWQQGSFPFYFVQIAPYGYEGNDIAGSAFLREAQLYAMLHTENTGMAVTMDIGDCGCIHPADKQKAGERLAYWALAKDYGIEGVAYSGPVYREMEILEEGKVKIIFDEVGMGLSFYGNPATGFEIAGMDRNFVPAKAMINRDMTLTVWSEAVPEPVAVRYAFKNCIHGTLYNVSGLPASSFRTDDWEQ